MRYNERVPEERCGLTTKKLPGLNAMKERAERAPCDDSGSAGAGADLPLRSARLPPFRPQGATAIYKRGSRHCGITNVIVAIAIK